MDVGGGPAVLGQLDIGMLENVVLLVNDRPLAPDKDDCIGVVHGPHFIWCKQFTATLSSGNFGYSKTRYKNNIDFLYISPYSGQILEEHTVGGVHISKTRIPMERNYGSIHNH